MSVWISDSFWGRLEFACVSGGVGVGGGVVFQGAAGYYYKLWIVAHKKLKQIDICTIIR